VVKVGSFAERDKAESIKTRLKGKGYDAVVKTMKHQVLGKVFEIQLQPVNSISRAATLMTQLRGEIEDEPEIIKVPSQLELLGVSRH
jgi:cell division septation protein DedD